MKRKNLFYKIIALLSLLSVSFFWKQEIYLFFILTFLSFFLIKMSKNKLKTIKMYLFSGAIGVLAESFAVSQNAWEYTQHLSFNVPIWLFPLWGIASIFLIHFYRDLK